MKRGAALYLVGSVALVALVGCGRGWVEQRDPWRADAERACLRSGAVKPSATAVQIRPIDGPGVCGAQYPFKVAALGDRTMLGYMREMRPPSDIPGFPIPEPRRTTSSPQYSAPAPYETGYGVGSASGGYAPPLSLHPPGIEGADEGDLPEEAGGAPGGAQSDPYAAAPSGRPHTARDGGAARADYPPDRYIGSTPERMGPDRAPLTVGSAAVTPEATLACPVVARLDQWMAKSVQPAAMRWFGQPVAEIRQISAYSCRGMNGQRGAPISEHAFGNALDISAFTLADGRRVTVKDGWRGRPEEQGFLRDVHAAACEHFSTVLAPGSNRFHYDHIHVDLARRRGGRTYCNPRPIPGDVIAGRAAGRMVTGSTSAGARMGYAPEDQRDEPSPMLPRAIPGAD